MLRALNALSPLLKINDHQHQKVHIFRLSNENKHFSASARNKPHHHSSQPKQTRLFNPHYKPSTSRRLHTYTHLHPPPRGTTKQKFRPASPLPCPRDRLGAAIIPARSEIQSAPGDARGPGGQARDRFGGGRRLMGSAAAARGRGDGDAPGKRGEKPPFLSSAGRSRARP